MMDVLNNPTKLIELRQKAQGQVTDEQFDEFLRSKGVSEDLIDQSKIPQPSTPVTTTEPIAVEPTPQSQTVEPSTPVPQQEPMQPTPQAQPTQDIDIDTFKNVWNKARVKISPEQMREKGKQLGFSDKELSFLNNKFDLMDVATFESYVDRLANKETPEAIIAADTQALLTSDATINDVDRAKGEATRRFMNFLITRDIKNGTSIDFLIEGKLKNKYPNLSDEDIANIQKAFKLDSESFISRLQHIGGDLLEGVDQDFLKVKKLLSYTGLIDFTEQDLAEQKRLEDLERKREIRSDAFLGLDVSDLSPLAAADFLIGAGKFTTIKGAIGAMTTGGLLGFTQSLESNATNVDKAVSTTMGALAPLIVKGAEKTLQGFLKFFTQAKFSDDRMLQDLANNIGEMKVSDFNNFLKFADENGYKLNIGSLTQKNSPTYRLIKVAKAYQNFVDSQTGQLAYNNVIINQAMKKTMDELAKGDVMPKLVTTQNKLGQESQLVDDYVNSVLQKNIKEFETKWKDVVDKAYDTSSEIASTIPVSNPTEMLYKVLDYRAKTPTTLDGTPAESMKAKLDKLIESSFKAKKISGNYTLDDLNSLSKSISSQFPMTTDRERNLIAITLKEHIAKLQVEYLSKLNTELDSKGVWTPLEESMKAKLPKVIEAYDKAKEVFTTKRQYLYDSNAKEYIGKFVTNQGAEVLDKLLKGANLEQLAHLKSAFQFVGKEKDFQLIGKRYVFNKINELFDVGTKKYDYPQLSNKLDDLLNESNKLELFGFDKQSVEALKNMKLLSNVHYNLKKIIESELDSTTNQLSVISRLITKIPDTIRGMFVLKTIPDNKKIIQLSKKLDEYKIQINKEIKKNPSLLRRIKGASAFTARGASNLAVQEAGESQISPTLNYVTGD